MLKPHAVNCKEELTWMWTLYCCVKSVKRPQLRWLVTRQCWESSCLFHYCASSFWLKFNLSLLILFCQLTNIIHLSSFVVITHSPNAKTKKTKTAAFFLDAGPWQKKKQIRKTKKKKIRETKKKKRNEEKKKLLLFIFPWIKIVMDEQGCLTNYVDIKRTQ